MMMNKILEDEGSCSFIFLCQPLQHPNNDCRHPSPRQGLTVGSGFYGPRLAVVQPFGSIEQKWLCTIIAFALSETQAWPMGA